MFALGDELNKEVQGGLGLNLGHVLEVVQHVLEIGHCVLFDERRHMALVGAHKSVQCLADIGGGARYLIKLSLNGLNIFTVNLAICSLLFTRCHLLGLDLVDNSERLLHHLEEGVQFGLCGE